MALLSLSQILLVQGSVSGNLRLIWNPSTQDSHVLCESVLQVFHSSLAHFLCEVALSLLGLTQLPLLNSRDHIPGCTKLIQK